MRKSAAEQIKPAVEETDKREIKYLEVKELRQPMIKLLRDLREQIDSGKYQLIVGDDDSGRIPTLIFDKVVRAIYEEQGYPMPETIFFAGEKRKLLSGPEKIKERKTSDIIKKKSKDIAGRLGTEVINALVITDTIQTVRSLRFICNALKKNNVPFDIATIGIKGLPPEKILELVSDPNYEGPLPHKWEQEETERLLGGKIFYGQMNHQPKVYAAAQLSGIIKKEGGHFHLEASNTTSRSGRSERCARSP